MRKFVRFLRRMDSTPLFFEILNAIARHACVVFDQLVTLGSGDDCGGHARSLRGLFVAEFFSRLHN